MLSAEQFRLIQLGLTFVESSYCLYDCTLCTVLVCIALSHIQHQQPLLVCCMLQILCQGTRESFHKASVAISVDN